MKTEQTQRFISAAADGDGWEDAARAVLETLGRKKVGAPEQMFNTGFIYLTDALTEDAERILTLFKDVTGVETWVGTVGLGVVGCGVDKSCAGFIDSPAIAAMLAWFDEGDLFILPPMEDDVQAPIPGLRAWTRGTPPSVGLVHVNPLAETEAEIMLARLSRDTGAYLVGGLSSSRGEQLQIAGAIGEGGLSGVLFSARVGVATAMTQGCIPLSAPHTVTECDGHLIAKLDGRPAFTVFAEDMQRAIATGTDIKPEDIKIDFSLFGGMDPEGPKAASQAGMLRGEIHVAFPVPGSDQYNYMVRNAIGVDPDDGCMAIAHEAQQGDHLIFVQRDDDAMRGNLRRSLAHLKARIVREKGVFAPKGALYISCLARVTERHRKEDSDGSDAELSIVREVMDDIPIAGFYANGEIADYRLYGYSALIIVFY